jgi:gamma-glutamyltranspeptidase/glutathione hydrolase
VEPIKEEIIKLWVFKINSNEKTNNNLSIISFDCKSQNIPIKPEGVVATKAIVISFREQASKIGIEILKKVGFAFGALVETENAFAV